MSARTPLAIGAVLVSALAWQHALGGQVPGAASQADVPISHHDRVYAAEQFSNTVSVIDPASNTLLGVIRLGDTEPTDLSPLYRGQLLVHGMGFSPDHRMLAVVAIGSNAVVFIDTATNTVRHITYVGRSPHEAFFTPDGTEVWVTVRGEDYVDVLDGHSYAEKTRIQLPNGPGMTIFSPDGTYGYVCSSFVPETDVITVADHHIVARLAQTSPFCPNIAVTPDGRQVWFTLKDTGKTQVFDARPPFRMLTTLDTGPITNHVNIVRNTHGQFAYVTVGGLNEIKVFRTDTFRQVATIAVGDLPHGLWPSGDGTRVYVGLENADKVIAIDALTNRVIAEMPAGQGAQALTYVTNAAPAADSPHLSPLGLVANAAHLALAPVGGASRAATSIALFDQGLTQMLEAAVTGLAPRKSYLLGLSQQPDGSGPIEPLARFVTNPAGAAIVNAVGPIRQLVQADAASQRRYLIIAPDAPAASPVQVQIAHP